MHLALHAAAPACARAPRASARSARRSVAAPQPCAARRTLAGAGAALPRRTALASSAVATVASAMRASAAAVGAASAPSSSALLIVGPGVLGSMVAALWLQARACDYAWSRPTLP
jgi:hypothetical protein